MLEKLRKGRTNNINLDMVQFCKNLFTTFNITSKCSYTHNTEVLLLKNELKLDF